MMKNPPHPGEIIREDVLAELGLTVAEAALRLGVSRVTLSRVVNGRAGISPNLAVRLELAGSGTARGWLAMQVNYDLARELDGKTHDVKPLDAA
jgi:addiction module HigA family antidote